MCGRYDPTRLPPVDHAGRTISLNQACSLRRETNCAIHSASPVMTTDDTKSGPVLTRQPPNVLIATDGTILMAELMMFTIVFKRSDTEPVRQLKSVTCAGQVSGTKRRVEAQSRLIRGLQPSHRWRIVPRRSTYSRTPIHRPSRGRNDRVDLNDHSPRLLRISIGPRCQRRLCGTRHC
jgi:hypothetical protein